MIALNFKLNIRIIHTVVYRYVVSLLQKRHKPVLKKQHSADYHNNVKTVEVFERKGVQSAPSSPVKKSSSLRHVPSTPELQFITSPSDQCHKEPSESSSAAEHML